MPAENAARQNNLDPKHGLKKIFQYEISIKKTWSYQLIGIEKFQLVHLIIININKNFF